MRASSCQEGEDLHFGLTFGEELDMGQSVMVGSDPELQETPAYSKGPPFAVNLPWPPVAGRAGMHSPPPRRAAGGETYESQPARLINMGNQRALACPTIQITTISPGGSGGGSVPDEEGSGLDSWFPFPPSPPAGGRDHLYLPLDPFGYREWSLSPSSASSFSSRGWLSDGASSSSPCGSIGEELEPELSEEAFRAALSSPRSSSSSSPCPSPCPPLSPRPSSPAGKRRHSGPPAYPRPRVSPSHRETLTDEDPLPKGSPSSPLLLLPPQAPAYQLGLAVPTDIPHKARRTSQQQASAPSHQEQEESEAQACPEDRSVAQQQAKKDPGPMEYLTVPFPYNWTNKTRTTAHGPVFRSCAPPPLDWPLPSRYNQLELRVTMQPRPHHRAHYETEGSRGAVKALAGGHPVVKLQGYAEKPLTLQMFIGSADDRNLRPHAFYQIHRITGKMVNTASQESLVNTTKILEVPLLPENNMTTNIDCAGILKLRNSDIELRKGETDIGRKNTRVKLVFRVHIPHSGGKVISLQATSIPIECSQRSAHELPQVDTYNVSSCPVTGGGRMFIAGCNFLPSSKVIFIEKGPDGRPSWEVEAKVESAETTETSIIAEVPPYHNQSLNSSIQVCFLICNSRKKRSSNQSFQYTPIPEEEEGRVEPEMGSGSSPRHQRLPPTPESLPLPPTPESLPLLGLLSPQRMVHHQPLPMPALPPGSEWARGCPFTPAGGGEAPGQINPGPPFTPLNHGHPLGQRNQSERTSHDHPNHGHPLAPGDHFQPHRGHPLPLGEQCQLLTHSHQGPKLAHGDHCQPLTHPHQEPPLAPRELFQPLTHPHQETPLAPGNRCQPLTYPHQEPPLDPSDRCQQCPQHHRVPPLAPDDQCQPLTHPHERPPFANATGDQLLTQTHQVLPVQRPIKACPATPSLRAPAFAKPEPGCPLTPARQGQPATRATSGSWSWGAPQSLAKEPASGRQCLFYLGTPDQDHSPGRADSPSLHTPLPGIRDPCTEPAHRPVTTEPRSGPGSDPAAPVHRGGPEDKEEEADEEGEIQECEVSFRTIPIQGITLDDVNEIIGWDLTDTSESLWTEEP